MFNLYVRVLTHERMPLLYRLAQLVIPELSLSAWQDYASARIARTGAELGGILVAEDRNHCVLGFASYLIGNHLRHVRILMVDNLVAPGITEKQSQTVLNLLLEAMEDLALDHDCNAVHVEFEAPEAVTLERYMYRALGTAGYGRELVAHCKSLESTL